MHTYMHAIRISGKRRHEFEGEWGWVYGRDGGGKGGRNVIVKF